MQKNKIIRMLLISALLFSALAGYLIYRYMSPARETIYVFNDSYQAGQQITPNMLTPLQVDANALVAGSKTSVGNYFITPADINAVIKSGDSLKIDVAKGMPITNSMLSVSGGSNIEMNLTKDSIAVSIPVNQFTGVTSDLKKGARVNIYSSANGVTSLIQQNKRVLEVFYDSGIITGVAIEENIDESLELINAETNGSIYLGLVDSTGYQAIEGEDPYYSMPEIFSDSQSQSSQVNQDDYDFYLNQYNEQYNENYKELGDDFGSKETGKELTEESTQETTEADKNPAVFTP